jgi:S1-C subfamily serine protease
MKMDGTPSTITGHGTAFAITEHLLFTAAHNVLCDAHDPETGEFRKQVPYTTLVLEHGPDGHKSWIACEVVVYDQEIDVALLRCKDVTFEPVKLATKDLLEDSVISLLGSKRGAELSSREGVVEQRRHQGSAKDRIRIECDHGDSGAPVFDKNGLVAGIFVCGISNGHGDLNGTQGCMIPVSVLQELIEKWTKK